MKTIKKEYVVCAWSQNVKALYGVHHLLWHFPLCVLRLGHQQKVLHQIAGVTSRSLRFGFLPSPKKQKKNNLY